MPSRIDNALPLPLAQPAASPAPDNLSRRSDTTPRARKDEAFSHLRGTNSSAQRASGASASPPSAANPAGSRRPGSNGVERLATFFNRAHAESGGSKGSSVPPDRPARPGSGPARSGQARTGAQSAQAAGDANRSGRKNDAPGAAGFERSNGPARPRPAPSRHSAAAGGPGFAQSYTYRRPSHPSQHSAGAYAAPHFTAHGYPQYVRPTWNRLGYHSRLFGAGQLFGFSYGFGQTAHGAGMHFGFHFNGRFHTLHVGLQPTTPQPFFVALNSGYTYGAPPYKPYAGGLYHHGAGAWQPGHSYGYAPYGSHQSHGPYGTTTPPFTGRWNPPSSAGSAPPPGSMPQGARPRPVPSVDQTPPKGFRQWYAVLGVPHDRATREAVKAQYRKDALRLHPDKPSGSVAAFQELQWAYTTALSVLDARERGEHVPEPPRAA